MKRYTVALSVIFIGMLCLACGPLWAAITAQELEEEHTLSMEWVTPHVAWGKPSAAGPVRALVFVDGRGTNTRAVVELVQRFDIQPTPVYYARGEFHAPKLGGERLLRLLQQRWDVFVIANVDIAKIPMEAQYRMLRQISEGAGLVAVENIPGDIFQDKRLLETAPPALLAGTPLTVLSAAQKAAERAGTAAPGDADVAAQILRPYRLGKGRGVAVNFHGTSHSLTPLLPFSYANLTEYEYWIAMTGRAILWAAGKPLPVVFGETAAPLQLTVNQLPATAALMLRNESNRALRMNVEVTVRSADGLAVHELAPVEVSVDALGQSAVETAIPEGLRAGVYFVDFLARSGPQAVGFGSLGVNITSAAGVAEVALDGDYCEIGQSITGTVRLEGRAAGDTLRVRLRDCYRRTVDQQDLQAAADTVSFEFPIIAEKATIGMSVEAALVRGEQELAAQNADFTVPIRRRGQYNMVMWDYPQDVLGYYAMMRLRDLGIGTILASGPPGKILAAANLSYIPYTTRILDNYDENQHLLPVPWNREPAIDEWVQEIVDKQVQARKHGTFLYSLGDETTTKGADLSPEGLHAYREWLKTRYADLAALNASWGSDYTDWHEVNVMVEGDNWEQRALQEGHYSRWFDRLHFARWNFAKLCERFVKAYEILDPEALTGFEGAGRFGEDYELICDTNGFWAPYPNIGDEIIRSITPRDFIRANWMGYNRQADPMISRYWRMISLGYDSVWYWRWDGIGRWHGYLAPDNDAYPAIKQLAADTRIVRDGLGDLLLNSERANDRIAIYYSMPSAWSGSLAGSNTFSAPQAAADAFVNATRDLGLEFNFITTGRLLDGALEGYRVLVLPFIQALSAEEAAVITDFAQNGGMVIADMRPGVFDRHCNPREEGVLDELFGIRSSYDGNGANTLLQMKVAAGGGEVALNFDDIRVDPTVQLNGAEAQGTVQEAPIMVRNRAGAGSACLLNFDFSQYDTHRGTGREDGMRELLRALYAEADITAPITMHEGRTAARAVQLFRWQAGANTIIALIGKSTEEWYPSEEKGREMIRRRARPVNVQLGGPRHVYDLRNGRYLGRADSINADISPGYANFYVLTDEPVPEVRMALSSTSPVRGEMVKLALGMDLPRNDPGPHAVKLSAITPDGSRPWWWERPVILRNGQASVDIPIAHDDPAGEWKVKVRELFTDRTYETSFTVR